MSTAEMTLAQVRACGRMAHHEPVDGIEFWWGPSAGVRMYFADGFPWASREPWASPSREIVVHADAGTNLVRFPVMDPPRSVAACGEMLLSGPTFSHQEIVVPSAGWRHMAGCDCEICRRGS